MDKEARKKIFEEHLVEQNKLRQIQKQQKQKHQKAQKIIEEDMLYIQKQFRTQSQAIEKLLAQYKKKQITFNDVHQAFEKLKKYYVQINYALQTYDRQYYKEALEKMYNTLIELKNKNEPRKRFKFSRRDEDFGVKQVLVQEKLLKKIENHEKIPGISLLKDQKQQILPDGTSFGSYKIVDCQNTQVQLLKQTEILFLKRLKNCVIKAATTKTTVFVDQCQNCIFELSCQQLRIHNTHNTTFGIFVTSKAIIEDCMGVKFKPYSFEYQNRDKFQQQFERKGKQNLWRQIQDFNWLKENQKSPHFDLIEQ